MSEKTKLKSVWQSIKEELVDLGSVDISTLEGTLKLDVKSDKLFNLDELYKAVQASVDSDQSELTLVAHTHVDFDLDAVMIAKPEAPTALMDAHNKAVATAIDARAAVLRLAKEVFISN